MGIQVPICQISYGDRPPCDLSEEISTAEPKAISGYLHRHSCERRVALATF